MTDKAKELQRKYFREWRKNNPSKVKEYRDRYWERKAAEMESADDKQTQDQEAEGG